MSKLPASVQPGDIISSELMTDILTQLAKLSESQSTGTQIVPDVFGMRLVDARTLITNPSRQLALGFVIDISGAAVDSISPTNSNLIVLNQSPIADTRVAPNTPVNLVVSKASTDGTQPSEQPPTITRTETATGTVTTSFAVNSTMVIVGTNFNAIASQNIVKFDNVSATVTADPTDPTRRLNVIVPTGIPGAPVNTGDSPKPDVVVSVQTPTGSPATTTITVTAPVAGQPTIESVSPASQFEGSDITITGTNFTSGAQVLIRDVSATIVSQTSTQIVATVPDFADITSGPPVPASVVVSIPGVADATFAGTFRVYGS